MYTASQVHAGLILNTLSDRYVQVRRCQVFAKINTELGQCRRYRGSVGYKCAQFHCGLFSRYVSYINQDFGRAHLPDNILASQFSGHTFDIERGESVLACQTMRSEETQPDAVGRAKFW